MITFNADHQMEVRKQMKGGKGEAHVVPMIKEGLCKNSRLFATITLPAGSSIGYHVHENETELFYFVSGTGRVQDDEKTVEVHPGDAMQTTSGHGHSVENIGEDDLVLVACIVLD